MSIASSYAAMSNADTARQQENRLLKQQEYNERQSGFTRDGSGNLVATDLRAAQEGSQKSQLEIMQEQLNATQQTLAAQQSKFNADGITNILASVVEGNWKDAYKAWNTTPGLKQSIQSAASLNAKEIAPINFSDPNDISQLKQLGIKTEYLQDPKAQDALLSSVMRVQGHDGNWRVARVDDIIKQTNTYNMFSSQQEKMYDERMAKVNSVIKGITPAQMRAEEAKAQTETGTAEITTGFIQDLKAQVDKGDLTPEKAFRMLTEKTATGSQRRDSLLQVEEAMEKLKDPNLPADE